jgi:hypothetical protein
MIMIIKIILNSKKQSPSWEASSRSATQEFPQILSQMNPVHKLPPYAKEMLGADTLRDSKRDLLRWAVEWLPLVEHARRPAVFRVPLRRVLTCCLEATGVLQPAVCLQAYGSHCSSGGKFVTVCWPHCLAGPGPASWYGDYSGANDALDSQSGCPCFEPQHAHGFSEVSANCKFLPSSPIMGRSPPSQSFPIQHNCHLYRPTLQNLSTWRASLNIPLLAATTSTVARKEVEEGR